MDTLPGDSLGEEENICTYLFCYHCIYKSKSVKFLYPLIIFSAKCTVQARTLQRAVFCSDKIFMSRLNHKI